MAWKSKWMFASARKKAEKESSLYYQTFRFVYHYYLMVATEEDRKVVDLVGRKVQRIYTDYNRKVGYPPPPKNKTSYRIGFNEDDVSASNKEYRLKLENELNHLFQNITHEASKQEIHDFIPRFKQGDITKFAHLWNFASTIPLPRRSYLPNHHHRACNGSRKKKTIKKHLKAPKLTQLELEDLELFSHKANLIQKEDDLCRQTAAFMKTFPNTIDTTPEERIILHEAYVNVDLLSLDLVVYALDQLPDSCCFPDVPVKIKEHRSKVRKELNQVCDKLVSNLAVKEAYRRLLADFQDPPEQIHHARPQDKDANLMSGEPSIFSCSKPLPICTPFGDEPKLIPEVIEQEIHNPHLQDKDGNLMSSKPDMSSGEGSSQPLPICDDELYYHNHDKCCRTPFGPEPEPIFEVMVQKHAECPEPTFADVESEEW